MSFFHDDLSKLVIMQLIFAYKFRLGKKRSSPYCSVFLNVFRKAPNKAAWDSTSDVVLFCIFHPTSC